MKAVISDRRSCHVNACRFIDCSMRADDTGNTTGLDLPDSCENEKPPASRADARPFERGGTRGADGSAAPGPGKTGRAGYCHPIAFVGPAVPEPGYRALFISAICAPATLRLVPVPMLTSRR